MKTKSGEIISLSEWIKRWKQGIKNVATNPTPIERLNQESYGTLTTLIGLIACLVVLIIYRESFFTHWFAYALILVFVGNIWTTGLKYIGIRQSLKLFKGSNEQVDVKESLDKLNKIFEEDTKVAPSQVAVNLVANNPEILKEDKDEQ
jgi:hypothetical protein